MPHNPNWICRWHETWWAISFFVLFFHSLIQLHYWWKQLFELIDATTSWHSYDLQEAWNEFLIILTFPSFSNELSWDELKKSKVKFRNSDSESKRSLIKKWTKYTSENHSAKWRNEIYAHQRLGMVYRITFEWIIWCTFNDSIFFFIRNVLSDLDQFQNKKKKTNKGDKETVFFCLGKIE